MRGVNKVIVVGHLGNDPETRQFDNGGSVTNISVATSEKWKDKNTGADREETEWHRVSFFGRLAEIAAQYLRKGSAVYVEGKLKTRKWTDKDGIDRYTTEVVANQLQMLGGGSGNRPQQQGNYPQQGNQPQQGNYPQQPQQANYQRQPAPQGQAPQQGGFNNQMGGQQQGGFNNQMGGQQQGGFNNQMGGQQQGGFNNQMSNQQPNGMPPQQGVNQPPADDDIPF